MLVDELKIEAIKRLHQDTVLIKLEIMLPVGIWSDVNHLAETTGLTSSEAVSAFILEQRN